MSLTPAQIAELQTKAARVDALEAENATLKSDNAKLSTDFAEAQKAQAVASIKAAIDPHVKAGRVLPAEVDQLAEFAASLDADAATFDFTDGDKVEKVSARALFLAQLGKRPVSVDFSERAKKDKGDDEPDVTELQRKVNDQVAGRDKK